MNPKITPEIRSALKDHPIGPVLLEGELDGGPVYLMRLDDIANLQALDDSRIREELTEADEDIAAGRTSEWNADDIKSRGRERANRNNAS